MQAFKKEVTLAEAQAWDLESNTDVMVVFWFYFLISFIYYAFHSLCCVTTLHVFLFMYKGI